MNDEARRFSADNGLQPSSVDFEFGCARGVRRGSGVYFGDLVVADM